MTVPRSERVEHRVVQPKGERPVVQRAGGAIARLPRDAGLPAETLVWLIERGDCGCAWGWTLERERAASGMTLRLVRCDQVEDELHHTAVHHLVSGGFSLVHHPAPGCTR